MEGYSVVHRLTQAQIDAGDANALSGVRIEVVDANGRPTGVVYESGPAGQAPSQTATASSVAAAVAVVTVKDWQANTAVVADEMRRAPSAAGTIEAGDLIRSNSARTTRAAFDATEAGNWTEFAPDLVTSVAGRTGAVTLAKADVGLGNVDNTSDANKPVSSATQTALNAKANTTHTHAQADITSLATDLAAKAPLNSPGLTGTPTAPTPSAGTNTTQVATTAFVMDAVTASQAGLDFKNSVRVATTGNITLSGAQTIDGVAVVAGDRVLVKDQTTANQNGIYDVAAGAWSRSTDANANNEVNAGLTVYVEQGTTQAQTVWTLTTAGSIVLGTTALTFARLFNTSGLEQVANKVTAFSSPTDTQYPSAKLVSDQLATKQATLVSASNIKTVNGASLLGAGNIAVNADLPGGTATTITDGGLATPGSPTIDRASIAGQTIITWTSGAGSFTVPENTTSVRVLVVAGGGGGGTGRYAGDAIGRPGGGGGAGGMLTDATYAVTPGQTINLSVGAGGAGATDAADTDNGGAGGSNGGNSTFGTLTAIGGGGGGGHYAAQVSGWDAPANTGGSGGGGSNGSAGAAGTSGQGNSGGTSTGGGGGGGGAAGAGGGGSTSLAEGATSGAGGAGVASDITGTSVTYAAGGASSGLPAGGIVGTNGAANTGNGGGGSTNGGNNGRAAGTSPGGNGGSGIVIVRFATQTRSYQALSAYASDVAAAAGGILVGQFYRDSGTGAVRQRVS